MSTDTKTPDAKTDATPEANGKPGRKTGSKVVRPDTSGFALDAIAAAQAAPVEVRELAAPRAERKPEQLAMDKVAERAHKAWIEADRPNAWPKMPVVTYYLPPTHIEGYKYLIRRACDFIGARPKFGTPARVTKTLMAALAKKGVNLPADYEGREILAWAVMDKRPRPTTNTAPATTPATDAK